MRIFHSLDAARADAHPGVYVMVSTGPVYALMSVGERERALNGGVERDWLTVERTKPFHDVLAETETGWHDDDIADDASQGIVQGRIGPL